MVTCEELERELEKLKAKRSSEFDLKPIEKWMFKDLGVKRLKSKGGSAVVYEHPAFKEVKEDGNFVVHLKHGGKREKITRQNFVRYLYKRLKEIIEFMRKEGLCDSETP